MLGGTLRRENNSVGGAGKLSDVSSCPKLDTTKRAGVTNKGKERRSPRDLDSVGETEFRREKFANRRIKNAGTDIALNQLLTTSKKQRRLQDQDSLGNKKRYGGGMS